MLMSLFLHSCISSVIDITEVLAPPQKLKRSGSKAFLAKTLTSALELFQLCSQAYHHHTISELRKPCKTLSTKLLHLCNSRHYHMDFFPEILQV